MPLAALVSSPAGGEGTARRAVEGAVAPPQLQALCRLRLERPRRGLEPRSRLVVEGRQRLAHARVVGVEPGDLRRVEQRARRSARRSIGRERQRLEAEHRPLATCDLARLARESGSRCGCRRRRSCSSPARSTGSCPARARRAPSWRCAAAPRARTDSCRRRGRCRGRNRARSPTAAAGRSRRAARRSCPSGSGAGDGDMALQHAREALAHLRRRLADRDRAGDVGRAVQILGAGIDQDRARPDSSAGRSLG